MEVCMKSFLVLIFVISILSFSSGFIMLKGRVSQKWLWVALLAIPLFCFGLSGAIISFLLLKLN